MWEMDTGGSSSELTKRGEGHGEEFQVGTVHVITRLD